VEVATREAAAKAAAAAVSSSRPSSPQQDFSPLGGLVSNHRRGIGGRSAARIGAKMDAAIVKAGPGRLCPPRHSKLIQPSFIDSNGIP